MKILHLISQDSGGAGRAALRLHKALLDQNIESLMLVQNKTTDLPSVIRLANTKPQKIMEKLRPALATLPLMLYPKRHKDIISPHALSNKTLIKKINEIKPDIISLAKGLGGGIPIGATFTRLKDIFVPGDHGSTFGGNFLSMRAGLCVLECLEELERSGRLQELSRAFLQNLQAIAKKYSSKFDGVSGLGLMLGLVCKDSSLQERIVDKALEQRLLILKAGKNVVRFLPPLLLSNEEMQEGFDRLDKALCAI